MRSSLKRRAMADRYLASLPVAFFASRMMCGVRPLRCGASLRDGLVVARGATRRAWAMARSVASRWALLAMRSRRALSAACSAAVDGGGVVSVGTGFVGFDVLLNEDEAVSVSAGASVEIKAHITECFTQAQHTSR